MNETIYFVATEKELQSECVICKEDTELKVEAQQSQKTMELESTEKNQGMICCLNR